MNMSWWDLFYFWNEGIGFVGSVLLGIMIGLYIVVLGPIVSRWWETYIKRIDEEKKSIENLRREAGKDQSKTVRRRARFELLKIEARGLAMIIFALAVLVGFLWGFPTWEAHNLRDFWTKSIDVVDSAKKDLRFRTIRDPEPPTCTEETSPDKEELQRCIQYEEGTIAVARREPLCQLRAIIQADQTMRDDVTRVYTARRIYKACMLEAGWFSEACEAGDEGCVEIPFVDSPCVLQGEGMAQG